MLEPSTSILIEYRLTEADVRHYGSAGLAIRFWRSCRGRKLALATMAALGGFLVGVCFHGDGIRAGGIAVGVTLAVIAALALAREVWFERQVHRLARQLGLPRAFRLLLSAEGITELVGPEIDDLARMFAWSEVVQVSRVDHLTVIRLRPASAVLIVPDSAFPSRGRRTEFEHQLQGWRSAKP